MTAKDGSAQMMIEANMSLLNMLALIHRDGGHHTQTVGVTQSLADAEQVLYKWRAAYDVLERTHEKDKQ